MEKEKKEKPFSLKKASAFIAFLITILGNIKAVLDFQSKYGTWIGQVTYYMGMIAFGIYIGFFAGAFLVSLIEGDDSITMPLFVVCIVLGCVLGIYWANRDLGNFDMVGLTFIRIIGVAAVLVPLYLYFQKTQKNKA